MRIFFSRRNQTIQPFEQDMVTLLESWGHTVESDAASEDDLTGKAWSTYDLLIIGAAGIEGVSDSAHPQRSILDSLPVNILVLNGRDCVSAGLGLAGSASFGTRDKFVDMAGDDPRNFHLTDTGTVHFGVFGDVVAEGSVWTLTSLASGTYMQWSAEYGFVMQFYRPGVAEKVNAEGWRRLFFGFQFFNFIYLMPDMRRMFRRYIDGLAPLWGSEIEWRDAGTQELVRRVRNWEYDEITLDGLDPAKTYEVRARPALSQLGYHDQQWFFEWTEWTPFDVGGTIGWALDATEVGDDVADFQLEVDPQLPIAVSLNATETGNDTTDISLSVAPVEFDVRWRQQGNEPLLGEDATEAYFYDITSLTPLTGYEWAVRTRVSPAFTSDWSEWVPFTTVEETVGEVNVTLVPGQATGAGRELHVAVIVNVEAQAGQAVAAGRTLVPDVQVSIPASVTIEAGQAVTAGRALVTAIGVAAEVNTARGEAVAAGRLLGPQGGIAETLQSGVGAATGRTLTTAAGVSVDLQAAQAIAAGGQLSTIAGATATIAPATASAAGLPVDERAGIAQGLFPGQATSSGHTLQGQAGAAVEAQADLQPGVGTTAGRTLAASVGRVSSLIAGASLAQGQTLGGAAGQTAPLTAGQAIGGAIALAPLAGARVSLIAPQTAAGAGRALEPFADQSAAVSLTAGQGVGEGQLLAPTVGRAAAVSLIAGQGAGNGRWLSLSAGAQVELVSGAALSQGRSLEPQVTGSADVDLLRGAATAQGRNLQPEVGAVVGAEADLQKGVAEGAGRTLSPAAGMIIDLSRGFSEAGGRLLSPQAGVSVPATVALLTGQATAAGRALQLDSGVGVNETVQPGHANVLGKQLSFQAGHNILFVAGAAVGAGRLIEGTSTHLLGRCKDPDSISLTTRYESISATPLLNTERG